MRAQGGGWWLATLAAVLAGACFAIAFWGATGRFTRASAPGVAVGATAAASTVPGPMPAGGPRPAGGSRPVGYPDGTCLGTVAERGGELAAVSCDAPHVFEVIGTLHLDGVADGPYPTDAGWEAIGAACIPRGEQYLGAPIPADRAPRLVATLLRIPEPAWVGGARTTSCVLLEVDEGGALVTRTGRVSV